MCGYIFRKVGLLSVICFFICGYTEITAQVIENPVFDRKDNLSFRVNKVELTKDTTYIYCLLSMEPGSWANISKETYLCDVKSGRKFPLLKSVGLPYSPQKKSYFNSEKCIITLCFPPLGKVTKFDLIENPDDKAFNVYGINIDTIPYRLEYKEHETFRKMGQRNFYFNLGNYEKAMPLSEQAVEECKYLYGIHSEEVFISLDILSYCYHFLGNNYKAIENLNEALDVLEKNPNIEKNVEEYMEILSVYYNDIGDFQKAIDILSSSIEKVLEKHGENSIEYSEILIKLSKYSNNLGNYNQALQYAEQANNIIVLKKLEKSDTNVRCISNYATAKSNLGFYEEAISANIKAYNIKSELYDVYNIDNALFLGNASYNYGMLGKYDEAIEFGKKACFLYSVNKVEDDNYMGFLSNISLYYFRLASQNDEGEQMLKEGLIEKAQAYSDSAIIVASHMPDYINNTSASIVAIQKQTASCYSLLDENKKAIIFCDKALTSLNSGVWSNKINMAKEQAEILAIRCQSQQRSGLKDDAIASGEVAKKLYESLNIRSLKYAELLADLAWAYGLNLDYEKSIELQCTAAEIYQSAKDWISLAEVYNSISHYYQSAERLDNAELYIKKAIDVLNEHDNAEQYIMDAVEQTGNNMMNNPYALASIKLRIDTDKSNFLQTLARIYQKQGNYADAVNTEIENGKILKGIGDTQMYAVHLLSLSEYYLRNNQPQDAIECSEQSIQLLNNYNRISLALPKLQLSIICFQAGDTSKAIRYAEESLSASNSNNDVESKISAQTILSYLYWKNSQISKAENCLSDELDYLKKFIINELSGMTTEQKQRLWDKYEHNFLLYRNIVEKSDRNADLLTKLYDYILFSKSLLLDFQIQQKNNSISRLNIKWKDIQKHLSNDAIAIEFISTLEDEGGYNTYHALVIDKNCSSPKMITLYSESKLEEIKGTGTRNIRDIVGELIWKPVLEQYATVKDIYFSPDGILHMLPIEYYSADGTNNMFENYNMYRLSSTKELIRESENRLPNSAVLYGGLNYNQLKENDSGTNTSEKSSLWRGIANRGGFDPLFNTALETQEIKELLTNMNISTALYSGENGTEESFRNLSGQKHGIIHLATHGMYINPDGVDTKKNENSFDFLESLASINDPVKEDITLTHSFLVMAGGNRVIARERVSDKNNDGILTSKEISQLILHGLDLVVLSACESALGDVSYGGVYGLQRGFKKAGANTIVMSLDKVDDEATRILMVEFYRNLMSGKSKCQSLKDAQKHLRKVDNGKYDNPKYWASFIMLDGLN